MLTQTSCWEKLGQTLCKNWDLENLICNADSSKTRSSKLNWSGHQNVQWYKVNIGATLIDFLLVFNVQYWMSKV